MPRNRNRLPLPLPLATLGRVGPCVWRVPSVPWPACGGPAPAPRLPCLLYPKPRHHRSAFLHPETSAQRARVWAGRVGAPVPVPASALLPARGRVTPAFHRGPETRGSVCRAHSFVVGPRGSGTHPQGAGGNPGPSLIPGGRSGPPPATHPPRPPDLGLQAPSPKQS